MQKKIFINFLKEIYPDDHAYFIEYFEKYHTWLVEENQKINLISRKTDSADLWTRHLLDSIIPVNFLDFAEKRILDFGTGGGLPGIPLAILHEDSEVVLLDSRKKKIQSIKSGVEKIGITNCEYIDTRLEEVPYVQYGTFDIVVCRSVRITTKYKKNLMNLLKLSGCLVLYKAKNIDDIDIFNDPEIHELNIDGIGVRKIVVVFKE